MRGQEIRDVSSMSVGGASSGMQYLRGLSEPKQRGHGHFNVQMSEKRESHVMLRFKA